MICLAAKHKKDKPIKNEGWNTMINMTITPYCYFLIPKAANADQCIALPITAHKGKHSYTTRPLVN